MKISYTESGRQALEQHQKAEAQRLEEEIARHKYVLGDEVLEITAVDIREAVERSRPPRYYMTVRRINLRALLSAYVVVGVLATALGLFLDELMVLLQSSPQRFGLVVGGMLIAFFSSFALIRIRSREREILEKERLVYRVRARDEN